jgi:hypothetical protein
VGGLVSWWVDRLVGCFFYFIGWLVGWLVNGSIVFWVGSSVTWLDGGSGLSICSSFAMAFDRLLV